MSWARLWLGYGRASSRTVVDVGGRGSRLLLLGSGSEEMACLAAFSAKEAGLRPALFDLGGSMSSRMSGYFDTFDYRSFLYDAFRLDSLDSWHAQLAAGAYSAALDLSSEEEAIINSAMQLVATEGTLLSPVSIHDVIGKVEGFRGFYVDKLGGRIGALKHFDAVEDQTFARLAEGNALLDFHGAPYPLAAELALALYIAKALAHLHTTGLSAGFVVITEAHRLFRSMPRQSHSNRLLSQLVGSPMTVLFASDHPETLSPALMDSCPVRLYSSDAWHSRMPRENRVLSGSFVVDDRRSGVVESFIPRLLLSMTGDYASARASRFPSPHLAESVLHAVQRFPLSTPESVVQFLSDQFLPADISSALSGLQARRFLILEPKDNGLGSRVFCLTLTEDGRKHLEELRG